MFIVKIRIILFGCTSTIYSGTERRGNRLVARDRERVCVCGLALQENVVGVRCKTAACERVDFVAMRTLNIKVVCLRNYLNCERGIREKDTLRL
jgi:hypothetical protein